MEKLDEGFLKIAQSSNEIFEQRPWVVPKVSQPSQQRPQGPKPSWVKISQIRTLAVERIGKGIGRISPEELDQIIEGLYEIIGS